MRVNLSDITALVLTPVECSWIAELIENDTGPEGGESVVSKARIEHLLKQLADGSNK